ncbi:MULTISPECIES: hypothetical protein [unclassified Sulfitobacter]|jgi:MFS family permease|uniref:hypothetical protein n=1 Tax=unclassified Sulfitobacter TaxID=196795 RepID=UPI0020CC3A7D|nr:hypothetical protein [Sulfitobacter sp. HGT1]
MQAILDALTDRVAQRAAETAQTAAIGLGAGLCLVVGSIFLSAAAWIFLLTITSTLIACLVIGGVFFGAGLVMVAATSIRSRNLKHQREAERLRLQAQQRAQALGGVEGIATLVVALINGFNAGKNARL